MDQSLRVADSLLWRDRAAGPPARLLVRFEGFLFLIPLCMLTRHTTPAPLRTTDGLWREIPDAPARRQYCCPQPMACLAPAAARKVFYNQLRVRSRRKALACIWSSSSSLAGFV